MPADLGEILRPLRPGGLPGDEPRASSSLLLRAKYLVDVESHTQVRGLPFRAAELAAVLQDVIDRSTLTANGAAL